MLLTNATEQGRDDTILPAARLPAASQVDTDASAVPARSHRAPRRRKWPFVLLLVAGWLIQAGLRAWFSRAQAVPLDNPDETAYLIAARVLAGGPGGNFSGATLYQGGYPLLITPVYWFTSSPAAVYHAALLINAAVSATVMPLGYLVCRRLGLGRPAAYGVAMVAALLPAGFFYSEYAIADSIFPVITLAWLLVIHSWLVAESPRARYTAAVGSAVMSGYAYTVHSRGSVLLAGLAVVAVFMFWRRPASRRSVAAAVLAVVVIAGAGYALNRYLVSVMYPDGTRSLPGELTGTLTSGHGILHVVELAGGQVWRLVLDSWGIAGIGLIAGMAAIWRRSVRSDLRFMAFLAVGITVVIACLAPAGLGPHQPAGWTSGRYLDGMIVTFFLVGATVLLRAAPRPILAVTACVVGLTIVAAEAVAVYAGTSLPTGPGKRFNLGEPAVLTQNWSRASVLVATAAALVLLFLWVFFAVLARYLPGLNGVAGVAVAAVSLVAVAQVTAHCSQVDNASARAAGFAEMAQADALKPGQQIAIASNVSGILRIAQAFEVPSTQLQVFNFFCQPPPADVTVIDAAWPSGKAARASWPDVPAGWQLVAANRLGSWAVWRRSTATAAPGLMVTGQCKHPRQQVSISGQVASTQT
jgi:hypothetical protein